MNTTLYKLNNFVRFVLLFSIMIIGFASYSLGQYQPTLKEGRKWINYFHGGWLDFTAESKIITDSIVDGTNYKFIRQSVMSISYLLREDSAQKQIFLRDTTKEWLLYDYTMLPGDTCYCNPGYPSSYLILDSISENPSLLSRCNDPINIGIPNPRVFYFTSSYNTSATWIEGIGSLTDLSDSHGGLGTHGTLLCRFDEVGNRDFHASYDCYAPESCFGYVGIGDELELRQAIFFYPNPVKDVLSINIDDPNLRLDKVSIYNLDGKQEGIYEIHSHSRIDLSSLQKGIFLLQIELQDGRRISKKVIKE